MTTSVSPTACSVLLSTLRRADRLTSHDLMDLCRSRSLRAGALNYGRALCELLAANLVAEEDGLLRLSETGTRFASLTNEFDEPTVDFEVLWAGVSFARAELTRELDLGGAGGFVAEGVASLEAALELEQLGLVELANGRATATSSLAFALVAGTGAVQPDRDAVGDLAERMSIRYLEETAGSGCTVIRVSELSDRFGYDVLVLSPALPPAAYECKGTTGSWPLHVFLSRHEMRTAEKLGHDYKLIVWGELRLAEEFDAQYRRLTSSGYPLLLTNPQNIFADCWSLPAPCVTHGAVPATLSVAAIELELQGR